MQFGDLFVENQNEVKREFSRLQKKLQSLFSVLEVLEEAKTKKEYANILRQWRFNDAKVFRDQLDLSVHKLYSSIYLLDKHFECDYEGDAPYNEHRVMVRF